MTLTGTIRSSNRHNLLTHAKELAIKYYGHDCVNVNITNEHSLNQFTPMPFQADYHATEHNYGPYQDPSCNNCGAEQ